MAQEDRSRPVTETPTSTRSPRGAGRHIGLFQATGVGVGAIVGGGILALAGTAFAVSGPGAVVAFALNGVIALLTAVSFAEMASKFPLSGGTYAYAKKVLSVEAAFAVGWVVWFAYIVAGVLYAIGFGHFACVIAAEVWSGIAGPPPQWLGGRESVCTLAVAAVIAYSLSLMWKRAAGGMLTNVGKVVLFVILIAAGLWAARNRSAAQLGQAFRPFMAGGAGGLLQAMGFTFIALQGFDLIAAVGGEVRNPTRNIPRAMFSSLGIALLIYLPLMVVIPAAGLAPGESIMQVGSDHPETIIALAASRFLGPLGYWLVLVAAVLAMLSALQANLLAASHVAMTMARDRTLPAVLGRTSQPAGTPRVATAVTALIVAGTIWAVPNVASAGAASSLIFLVSFALVHWIAMVVRRRSQTPPPFRAPWFPVIPLIGGLACLGLAVYQGICVPSAGLVAVCWLGGGGLLFVGLFARRAKVTDAGAMARDPEITALRGRNPLVLVPIARPNSAVGLVAAANALAPPGAGRVLLLSVVIAPTRWRPELDPKPLLNAQAVLGESLLASAATGVFPETLATVASEPWREISRVAAAHRCETLLLGLSRIDEHATRLPLETLFHQTDADVVLLRAPDGWRLADVRRVLVPVGGHSVHHRLLARLLGSLARSVQRQVRFLRVVPPSLSPQAFSVASRRLQRLARDVCDSDADTQLVRSEDPVGTVCQAAAESDLLILGVQRLSARSSTLGPFVMSVAQRTTCPLIIICCR